MAGIDKMYWTYEQTLKFYEWFFDHYKINEQGRDMLESLTEVEIGKRQDKIHMVTHFSTRVDKYLQKHCPLDFIQKRLDEQYEGKVID